MNIITLREIPEEFEAILFNGENADEIERFARRHGAQIEFTTNEESVTSGTLHTPQGSERVIRNHYVLASKLDQVSRVPRTLIDDPKVRKYVIVDLEAEARNADIIEAGAPPKPKTIECESCHQQRLEDEITTIFSKNICSFCVALATK